MSGRLARAAAAWVALALASCVHTEEVVTDVREAQAATPQATAGNPYSPHAHDEDAVNYHVNTSEELEKIDNGAEGEVYYTDPTDPDKEIEGITAAFEAKRKGNGWLNDYALATRLSRQEQKPLVIWFHDSVISPKSKKLGAAWLNTKRFDEWCSGRVIRLRLDSGAGLDEARRSKAKYSAGAINRLAMSYGVKRRPALAVVTPNGKLTESMDGYEGFAEEAKVTIERGVEAAEKQIRDYRDRMSARGFRMWTSRTGRMIFAKIHRFDEESGVVYFKNVGGKISRCGINKLCREDAETVDEMARHGEVQR